MEAESAPSIEKAAAARGAASGREAYVSKHKGELLRVVW
jgi:hypothetical protein